MMTEDLVGKPYRLGGRGPDAYDCAGLVVECLRRRGIDIEIPSTGSKSENYKAMMSILRQSWREVDVPREGVLVFIKPAHVGMMVNRRELIHAAEWRDQVLIEYLDSPHLRPCFGGFYEYAGKVS